MYFRFGGRYIGFSDCIPTLTTKTSAPVSQQSPKPSYDWQITAGW